MDKTIKETLEFFQGQFLPEYSPAGSAIFHFTITGEPSGDFTINISNGICNLTEGLEGTADCVVQTNYKTFKRLVTGKGRPAVALMTGKLKVSNIGRLMAYAKSFQFI